MERPSARRHRTKKKIPDWHRRSPTCVSKSKPCSVSRHPVLLIGVRLRQWTLSIHLCHVQRTQEAIYSAVMFSLLLSGGKSPLRSSENLQRRSPVDWSRSFLNWLWALRCNRLPRINAACKTKKNGVLRVSTMEREMFCVIYCRTLQENIFGLIVTGSCAY